MDAVAAAPFEDQIRRMASEAAPPEQRAEVQALFQAMDTMAHDAEASGAEVQARGAQG
jgi:hypothetical protein